jgi:MoxR-like ATPase
MFAYSLAWELGLGEPLKFETKSISTSGELFYTYDALKHFRDVQTGVAPDSVLPYLTYHALGMAILRSREPSEVAAFVPPDFEHPGKTRSVVLIDEVDKAPRDFPNDILNELEEGYFRVPELGNAKIEADWDLQPIVIITSNSEKDLPDAFLRRCIYYNIPFPEPTRIEAIVSNHLDLYAADRRAFLRSALELFHELRKPSNNLRKKPATAELLGWMLSMMQFTGDSMNPLAQPELAQKTLSSLVKTRADQRRAKEIVREWMNRSTTQT